MKRVLALTVSTVLVLSAAMTKPLASVAAMILVELARSSSPIPSRSSSLR